MSDSGGLKSWLKGPSRSKEKPKSSSAELDRRRIAVLPFANMSPDPNDEYFSDGITEELIATISKIPEVSVVSRTSAMQYKKNPKAIPDVAGELRAGTILEGSVRKSGNKVRVTIQLVDATQDKSEWAESYDRGLEDIFAIQSDISRKVAEVLSVQLLSVEEKRLQTIPTRNTEAYTLFLRGRAYMNNRTREGFQKAIVSFEDAVKLDPRYSSAYAGLSDCYSFMEPYGYLAPQTAWPKAFKYAMKALELDDTLSDAHTSLALCLLHLKWDWKGSEREYRRALELNPSYANAHYSYALNLLQAEGRFDEAIREIREAGNLDPFSLRIATNTANVLLWAGHHNEAIRQFEKGLMMDPQYSFCRAEYGLALVSMSLIEEGTAEIERALDVPSPGYPKMWSRVFMVYAKMAANRRGEAEKILEEVKKFSSKEYVPAAAFAAAYAALGEKSLAFEWLNRAVEDRTSAVILLLNTPLFDVLRADPRFSRMREQIGLSPNPTRN